MKKLLFFVFLVGVMVTAAGCSGNSNTSGNETGGANHSGNQPKQETSRNDAERSQPQELIVVGQEISLSLDPVQPLTTAYLRNIGAAEALFKVNADGEVEPELAESVSQLSPSTW